MTDQPDARTPTTTGTQSLLALQRTVDELRGLLRPVLDATTDRAAVTDLVNRLGWRGREAEQFATVLATAGTGLTAAVDDLATLAFPDPGDEGAPSAPSWGDALELAGRVFEFLRTLSLPAELGGPERAADVADELLALMVQDWLHSSQPFLAAVLELLQVAVPQARGTQVPDVVIGGGVRQHAHLRPRFDASPLGEFLRDPAHFLATQYAPHGLLGAGAIEAADAVFPLVAEVLERTGIGARFGVEPYFDQPMTQQEEAFLDHALTLWWSDSSGADGSLVGLVLGFATAGSPDDPPVVVLAPLIGGELAVDLGGWSLAASLDSTIGVALSGWHVLPSASESGSLQLQVSVEPPAPAVPASTLSAAGSVRLMISSAGRVDIGVRLGVRGALTLRPGDLGEGFLSSLLPRELRLGPFEVAMVWDENGVRLEGSASVGARTRVASFADVQLGPVTVSAGHVDALVQPDRLQALLLATAKATLGPFAASVAELGLTVGLSWPSRGGNLGPLDIGPWGFQPPNGVGLSLSTPAVSGGGFLLFDELAGRYAGVFELTLLGTVSVKAIALVTTKLPNGSPGFALLVVITAEGFTPVPLGMGFTLTGIGGLLALNRTVDPDTVRDGLRSGIVDSLLFAKDPVKNAATLLSTLDKVFPQAPDRLVVGPLAEISWGTPPVVKVRLALLLEVPQPIRAVLLAALSVLLPRPEDAVVELHVDAIGVLDLAKHELALDASLHDSRLLAFNLTGDLALRLRWGQDPTFVLSVGGFHPRFTPPPGIRPLNRLALTLTSSANPRLRFEAYLAVTSNTLQLGARVEVHAEAAGFGIDGGGSFDALIQWSPFALAVDFGAWVRLFGPGNATLLALSVALHVTGPRPWHVTGQASVQLLCLTASVGIDVTIGPSQAVPEPVRTVDVAALLWQQVADPNSWHASLPADVSPGVTTALSAPSTDGAPPVAHPLAAVELRQRVVPLGIEVSRIGGAVPSEGTRRYDLRVQPKDGVRVSVGAVADLFAMAQYVDMADDEKLTAPSFEPATAGISLAAANAVTAGPAIAYDLAVEVLVVDALDTAATPTGPVPANVAAVVP